MIDAYPWMIANANCQKVLQMMEFHLSLRMDSERSGTLVHIEGPIRPKSQILLPIVEQKMPCL